MSRPTHLPSGEPPATPGALLVVGAMLVTMPLLSVQGPANVTLMDAVNALFVALYWGRLLARRERLAFPLAFPFWLIMVGSFSGMYAAVDRPRGLLTIAQDCYLYLWFATVTDFLTRHCRVRDVATVWIVVACAIALGTFGDLHAGILGGRLAGGELRATGTFQNPNMFGDYLVFSFFLAWGAAAGGRPVFYLAMLAILLGVDSTASNGATMSILGGTAAVVAAQPMRNLLLRAGVVLVAAALAIGVVGTFRNTLLEGSLAMLSGSRGELGGAALKGAGERFPLWLDAIESVRRTPSGVGPGNFNREGGLVSGDYHAAHNDYLGMLAERSPIGLVGWLGLLVSIFLTVTALRAAAAAGAPAPLAVPQLYGLLGAICAHSIVIELFHFRHFWLALALLWAAAARARGAFGTTGAAVAVRPAFAEAA